METKSESKAQNTFLWLATIIGFVVDTVALIGIFSTFGLGNSIITGTPTVEIPKINLAFMTLEWKDVSLVVILYLFFTLIAFSRFKYIWIAEEKSKSGKQKVLKSEDPKISYYIWFNAVIFLFFLWTLVFVFPSSKIWDLFYFILLGWVFSIGFSIVFSYFFNNSEKYDGFFKPLFIATGILVFLILPALTLFVTIVFNLPFFSTLGILFLVALISVGYTVILLILGRLLLELILWVTKNYYGLPYS